MIRSTLNHRAKKTAAAGEPYDPPDLTLSRRLMVERELSQSHSMVVFMRIAEDRCSLTRLLWTAAVAALRACAAATRRPAPCPFCGSKSKVWVRSAVRRDVRRVGERGYPGRAKRDERGRAILHEENASNSTKPGAKHASTPVAVDARGGDKRAEGKTKRIISPPR